MAVLGEVQREVESGDELGLEGPRFVLLDPAHSRGTLTEMEFLAHRLRQAGVQATTECP
jgi:hypothetical protein